MSITRAPFDLNFPSLSVGSFILLYYYQGCAAPYCASRSDLMLTLFSPCSCSRASPSAPPPSRRGGPPPCSTPTVILPPLPVPMPSSLSIFSPTFCVLFSRPLFARPALARRNPSEHHRPPTRGHVPSRLDLSSLRKLDSATRAATTGGTLRACPQLERRRGGLGALSASAEDAPAARSGGRHPWRVEYLPRHAHVQAASRAVSLGSLGRCDAVDGYAYGHADGGQASPRAPWPRTWRGWRPRRSSPPRPRPRPRCVAPECVSRVICILA